MTIEKFLPRRVHGCLVEALRRFECFAVPRHEKKWTIEDMTVAWTGLGHPREYRDTVDMGLMVPLNGKVHEGENWYQLTPRGAEIVLLWHTQGFKCHDYEAPTNIPQEVEVAPVNDKLRWSQEMEAVKSRIKEDPRNVESGILVELFDDQGFTFFMRVPCSRSPGDGYDAIDNGDEIIQNQLPIGFILHAWYGWGGCGWIAQAKRSA